MPAVAGDRLVSDGRGRCCTGSARRWCVPAVIGSPTGSRSTRHTSAGMNPAYSDATAGRVLTAVAVEAKRPGFRAPPDGSRSTSVSRDADSPFSSGRARATTVNTDGWQAYCRSGRGYQPRAISLAPNGDDPAHEVMPGVHRVATLVKRWLLAPTRGPSSQSTSTAYIDEFAFRFNRAGHGAVACSSTDCSNRQCSHRRALPLARRRPGDPAAGSSRPPGPGKPVRPPSLAGDAQDRPWRTSPATMAPSTESLH